MSERAIEVKVGVLVTICLGLLTAFVIALGDFSLGDGSVLYLDVSTSADLKPGAPIKIAGTPAGKVTEVDFKGGVYEEAVKRRVYVRITLSIDPDKLASLHEDASFYITTLGLLGEKYVEIDPGTTEARQLQPRDVVEGVPPLRLEVMASNANALISSLSGLVRRNEKEIDEMIASATQTMKTVQGAVETVEKLVKDNETKVSTAIDKLLSIEDQGAKLLTSANTALGDGTAVNRTIVEVEELAGDARRYLGPIAGDVRTTLGKFQGLAETGQGTIDELRGDLRGSLGKVDTALGSAQSILADVGALTKQMKSGKGTIGALIMDKEMYDDIREMMKDLKRHPWKFLWKE
jgi:phospholipid/cholesterol/gamma-HCH transport system substrate-binding protein